MATKTINVVGCGKAGRTLTRLWRERSVFQPQSILNRSLASAQRAVEFVGGGKAIASYAQIELADAIMISAPDESIEDCCEQLCRTGTLREGVVVFHLSGSLPSTLLAPARSLGASIAGLHPVASFADPALAAQTFVGTFCAVEGDPEACEMLQGALTRLGAIPFRIEPEFKTIYHAGTVMACNYLVALLEAGLRCFEKAGLSRETAIGLIEPIVRGTLDNVRELGPAGALTGPIARGEASVVARQCEALGEWDPTVASIYKSLGQMATELSAVQGNAERDSLDAIRQILQG